MLDDLVRGALGAHAGAPGMRLLLPPVHLSSSLASNLALAVHELASNAAKYGALSTPLGNVDLQGSVVDGDLRLVWRERGGPEVRVPSRRGFGTTLLADVLTHQHGARVDLDWQREGLTCTLILPLEESPINGHCRGHFTEVRTRPLKRGLIRPVDLQSRLRRPEYPSSKPEVYTFDFIRHAVYATL